MLTRIHTCVSADVQRNLKNLKSLWKEKKNEARSGKSASQRQIQKPVLFTDVMTGPQGNHPHTERILIAPEPQLSIKQKSKIHHRRLKENYFRLKKKNRCTCKHETLEHLPKNMADIPLPHIWKSKLSNQNNLSKKWVVSAKTNGFWYSDHAWNCLAYIIWNIMTD